MFKGLTRRVQRILTIDAQNEAHKSNADELLPEHGQGNSACPSDLACQGSPAIPFIPKGVIFDMDGLMLDTEQLELQLYVTISCRMGRPTPESALREIIGVSDEKTEALFKKKYGPDYPFREIWAAVKEQEILEGDKNGLPLKNGLLVLLDKLDRVPLVVATSSDCKRTEWKLLWAGIVDRFKILACGDEVQWGKPAPDIYLLAADRLGVESADCAGFEDSPAGLMGLAATGIPSVFVKDLVEPPPEILRTVWRRCTDLEEAASLFGDKKYGS